MFDPTLPKTDSEMKSKEMRDNFNGLNDKIVAIPAPPTNISQLTNDAGYITTPLTQPLDAGTNDITCNGFLVGNLSMISLPSGQLLLNLPTPTVVLDWYQQKLLGTWTADALTFSPANPGHWAGTPPVTLAEAIDRLAAAVSGNGATPVA